MDLEKGLHIPELYDLMHRNDDEIHPPFDYKDKVLSNSLSKQIYKNETTGTFLDMFQDLIVHMIDSNVITRNWFNPAVSKYYSRHNN